ncbi:hypothetical protein PybrP1_011631 [[Pythium] brassicae (nom. inval.)]|nr:hypothetical protein PybrP1_011631 [[Pythium] brassicae (nom. inval.)]
MSGAAGVALVTGGSSGIGFAVARLLHSRGWRVAITSRDLARAQQAADRIAPSGDRLLPLAYHAPISAGSASPHNDATAVVAKVAQEFGAVSALVNAAGVSRDSLLLRLRDSELDELLHTNLAGPILMTKAVAKGMIQQRRGSIVTIGSVVGAAGNAGQTAYSASKAGLAGATKSLAKELGSRGVRVNLVEPGFIATAMTDAMPAAARERVLPSVPLGRLGSPDDVAQLVAFLASDDASYITGQCIRIDGGLVL